MNPADDDFEDDSPAATSPDEVLVAYLDGQLDAEQSEQLEARLATDAAIREKLQTLDRVWNALDALPRSTASATFTRTTVDMAAVSASQASPSKPRRWRPPVWLLASGVGLLAGALLTLALVTAPERSALNNLPTVLNANALENVGTIGFLKSLHERIENERAGRSLRAFRTEEALSDAEDWEQLLNARTPERREWIAALPPDELTAVNSAVDRFYDRSSEKREKLKALARQVDEDPQASELRETALAYQAMVGRLPQSEQARIRQMDEPDRLTYVVRQSRKWSDDAALELDESQSQAFRAEIDRLVGSDEFREEAMALARRFPPLRDVARVEPRLVLMAAPRFLSAYNRRFSGSPGAERFRQAVRKKIDNQVQRFEEDVVKPTSEAWRGWSEQLTAALPPHAQKVLKAALQRNEAEHAWKMSRLINDALTEDLSDGFVNLPEEEMERVLLAPRDQFAEQLSVQSTEMFEFDRWSRRDGPSRDFGGSHPRPDRDDRGRRLRDGPPHPPGGRPPFGPGGGPPRPPGQ